MNIELTQKIDELLYLTLEDAATPEQINRLNMLMGSDPAVMQYVADYYFITAALRKGNLIALASLGTQDELNEIHNLLFEIALEEKVAPSLEIEPVRNDLPKTYIKYEPVKIERRINPYSFVITIASLAAFLMMVVYLQIAPKQEPVAVLTDSIDAQWHSVNADIQSGFLFYNTDDPVLLKKGIVEIEFDYGAKVVIEGPTEFACKSGNQIYINYGRLYARVPARATGFTVETENSRIVDLGTEFGVQVNVDGLTELHVHKGLTKLLTGKKKDKGVFSIAEGQAMAVSPDGESVKEIRLKQDRFVQQIYSETGLLRKGQQFVDLADIVGGGNGFGTGRRDIEINPVAGRPGDISVGDRISDNAYRSFPSNLFIDGIFVPNGGKTKQIVSSAGDVFSQCPATQSNYYVGITTGLSGLDGRPIEMDGVDYGQPDRRSIFMHANLGITYDLKAIRNQLDDVRLTRFKATVGLCNSSWRECNADIWVLVDGQVRYGRKNVRQKGILDVLDIELSENDRFLTLVTTDGGDPEVVYDDRNEPVYSIQSDWCLFAEPRLILE
jgi:hypothetical protein